jgi:hypothetical protein
MRCSFKLFVIKKVAKMVSGQLLIDDLGKFVEGDAGEGLRLLGFVPPGVSRIVVLPDRTSSG